MQPYKTKIFISSTILDMPSERAAALKAVEAVGGIPLMSEKTFNAHNSDSVTACLNKVRESHLYILILGGKFGWQPEGVESITELEYQTAQENNIPTLVFNTTYEKEEQQQVFAKRVGASFNWCDVTDAFQLKEKMIESIKEEINKWQKDLVQTVEPVFANLLRIKFPATLYIADLNLDRNEVIAATKGTRKPLKKNANWYDVTVAAIHQKNIRFPHDWVCHGSQLITFHNLQDHSLPLAGVIDLGTATPLSCDEFYSQSVDAMKVFKSLLRNCLKAKLHKLKVNYYKDEKLFAFMPVTQNEKGKWQNRKVEWTKKHKASRTVVKVTYSTKNPEKMSSARHLSFGANFHFFEGIWYVSIKPDWLITWADFRPSKLGFEKIQYIKGEEKNIHIFNHLNFILWFLQPEDSAPLFDEYKDYPFLMIESFAKLNAYPVIPDELWRKLESKSSQDKYLDKDGTIPLFEK